MVFTDLQDYLAQLPAPATERLPLLDSVVKLLHKNALNRMVFVCTHNSRRSHLAQIWAHIIADKLKLKVDAHSAGTEVTAFNPRIKDCLRRAGLDIEVDDDNEDNPDHLIRFSPTRSRIVAWSKTITDNSLPTDAFIALMTCDDADKNCPNIPKAAHRVALSYVDPKVSDDTELESETYDARCKEIAAEISYILNRLVKGT